MDEGVLSVSMGEILPSAAQHSSLYADLYFPEKSLRPILGFLSKNNMEQANRRGRRWMVFGSW